MAQVTKIHASKTPPRIHYIAEWAEKYGVSQADIVRATGSDKGTVSRWFSGRLPEQKSLMALAQILPVKEPNDLFHHPEDNWLNRRLRAAAEEDRKKLEGAVELFLPGKTGTVG